MGYEDPSDAHGVVNIHQPRTKREGQLTVSIPPYKHQAFPMLMYPKAGGRPKAVNSREEAVMMGAQWTDRVPEGMMISTEGDCVPIPKPEKGARNN